MKIKGALQNLGPRLRKLVTIPPARDPRFLQIGFRDMINLLEKMVHFQDRIAFRNLYSLEKDKGRMVYLFQRNDSNVKALSDLVYKERLFIRSSRKIAQRPKNSDSDRAQDYDRIHYGCGENIIKGWLNVDLFERTDLPGYARVDLLDRHPFHDDFFKFAFSEDLLEHFDQSDSLIFLSEAYRTLQPNGVLRLSFPGLEGILKKHYDPWNDVAAYLGKIDAYSFWEHRHFYAFEEIRLIANAIGFRNIKKVEFGVSEHKELAGLDSRHDQTDLNCRVELQK